MMHKQTSKIALGGMLLLAVAALSYTAGAKGKGMEAVIWPAADIKFVPLAPGAPLQMGTLWGNRDKGEYAMLLKLPPGFEAGMHSHTADYHAVLIQGTWVHTVEGDTNPPKDLAPGSYVFQPGKQNHNDVCKSKVECIIMVHQHAKGDFIPAKVPGKAPEKK